MNARLAIRMGLQSGAFSAKDARSCGVRDHELAALVRSGAVVRVRTGSYVDAARWGPAGPEERLALRALAVYRAFEGRWAVSHTSALALHGLPLPPLGKAVHLSRRSDGPARSRSGVMAHVGLQPGQTMLRRGAGCATPAVALVQSAAGLGLLAAVAGADAALSRELTTPTELAAVLGTVRSNGNRDAAEMVHLADARSESPGESRARVIFGMVGLPAPELQVVITAQGVSYRVDFLFRDTGVIVEFDGAVKYAGADGRAALVAEKRREDLLRSWGYEVVRLTWRDLDDPGHVRELVLAAMRRSRGRGSVTA